MTRLIADFNAGGHHATYLANLIRQGSRGPFLISTDIYNELAPDVLETPDVVLRHIPTKGHDAEQQVAELLQHIDRHPEITSAIHMTIDEVFKALFRKLPSLIGRPRRHISGVWLMSNLFYKRHDGLKNRLRFIRFFVQVVTYLTVARRAKIYFLNEELADYLRAKAPFLRKRIHPCPDPVDSTITAIGPMPAPDNDAPTVLFLGKHSVRKGTYLAVNAILKDWHTPLRLIVAGDISGDPRIATLKEQAHPHVTIEWMDRRLSEQEMIACYQRADIVAAPYQDYGGSSGIFNNSVATNKPLLVSDWGLLASRTRTLQAGLTFKQDDEQDLRAKLHQLLESLPWQGNQQAVEAFLSYHSVERLYRVVCNLEKNETRDENQ